MAELHLKIRKRAFPSQGRVRINVGILPELGIADGDTVDLVNENTNKVVSASTIADTMVGTGEIRVSEEDLEALGLKDGEEALVKRAMPLKEKAAKVVDDTHKRLVEEEKKIDTSIKKTAGDVKATAGKTADTIKKEAGKAGKKAKDAFDATWGRGKDL